MVIMRMVAVNSRNTQYKLIKCKVNNYIFPSNKMYFWEYEKILCMSNNTIYMFINFTAVSGTNNRRHPDVSLCRPQVWRVSLSKKTSYLEVQRNLLFYISIIFLLYSQVEVVVLRLLERLDTLSSSFMLLQ